MSVLASWAALPADERRARCRALAALARVFAGRGTGGLQVALREAETDVRFLESAQAEIDTLPTIPVRRMWSVMAALEPPAAPKPSVTRVL